MEGFLREKSVLCNKQLQEVKALEKEIKKKKGNARELLEKKLEEVQKRHEQELHTLGTRFGQTKQHPSDETTTTTTTTKRTGFKHQEYFFPYNNWNRLSKKELEVEASRRGLGKKGNREELVTKLTLFDADQRRRVEGGELDPRKLAPKEERKARGDDYVDGSSSDEESQQKTSSCVASLGPSKFLKKTTKEKARTDSSEEDSSSSSESDDDATSRSSEGGTAAPVGDTVPEDVDIPDTEKIRGSGRADGRALRRKLGKSHVSSQRGGKGPRRRPAAKDVVSPPEPPEEERQWKRERVMQQVLVKLLSQHPRGIDIKLLDDELKQLKVENFRPELLGYETIDQWIRNQPPRVLHYDHRAKRIFPARSLDVLSDKEDAS